MTNTHVLPSFYRYMESTRHLLLYRLDSTYPVPAGLRLPQVESLTLLHCSPESITRFLYPTYFPSVKRIHYLSAGPSDSDLHGRFGRKMDWVFPIVKSYPFYDKMVEAGWGRREQGLVGQYLVSHKQPWFDIYLPERGIVYGEWYHTQLMAYLHKKHCDDFNVSYPIQEESVITPCHIPSEMGTGAILDSRWLYEKECMTRVFEKVVINLPDATPYRSSDK